MTDSALAGLACVRCGSAPRGEHPAAGCASCRADGVPAAVSTVYDLDAAHSTFRPEALSARPFGPARYTELMPPGVGAFALAEGATPLLLATELAARIGVRSLWIKDESRNPTWSFKDRAAAIAAARARAVGARGLVVSSTGNAAAATSAYAATAKLPAVVLFALGVDPVMAGFVRSYSGAIAATRTKGDRWVVMRRCVEEHGFYPNSNYADPPVGNDPYAVDGYKAIAFEVWDQLGHRAPTGIVTPIGHGDSAFAIYKAFDELRSMGLSDLPRLVAGEIYGSLSRTIAEGGERPVKAEVDRATVASSIATAQSTYQALHALRASDGVVCRVSDEAVIEAQRLLVESEGLLVEAASAAGIAALVEARREGSVDPDGGYVFVNTSAGIKSIAALGSIDASPEVIDDDAGLDAVIDRVLTVEGRHKT